MGVKLLRRLPALRPNHISQSYRVAVLFAVSVAATGCASNRTTTKPAIRHEAKAEVTPVTEFEIGEVTTEPHVEVAPLTQRKNYDVRYMPVMGVKSWQLSDNFGVSRDGGVRRHKGIDIMAPSGRPLIAVTSGRIERTSSKKGGMSVWVHGDDGLNYYYAHLSRYEPGVATGSRVQAGQIVGYVGNTGNAKKTPAHLHMEIRRNGVSLNPYTVLKSQDLVFVPVGGATTGQDAQYAARTAPERSMEGVARRTSSVRSKSSKQAAQVKKRSASKSRLAARKSSSKKYAAKKSVRSKQLASRRTASKRTNIKKYASK